MSLQLSETRLSENEWLVLTDLSQSEFDYHSMIDVICEQVGILHEQILLVWASPPCNSISPVGPVNEGRGFHYRIHSEPHWPPREDDSKYSKLAKKHDAMTSRVIDALADSTENRGTQIAAENPRGGMERQLFMNAPRWKRLTHKHITDYCAWKHPYQKSENIWVSEFGWKPTGITGDGRCGGKCESGSVRADTGKFRHDLVLSGPTGTGPSGKGIERQKNAVPHLLLMEILKAAIANNTDPKRLYVLDLFAGFGSMRAAAKAAGLGYIAVDERDVLPKSD